MQKQCIPKNSPSPNISHITSHILHTLCIYTIYTSSHFSLTLCVMFGVGQHTQRDRQRFLSWIPSIGTTIEKQKHSLGLGYKRVSFCFSQVGMPFKWPSRTNGVVMIPFRNHINLLLIYSLGSPNPMVINCAVTNFLFIDSSSIISYMLCFILE